MVNRKVFLDMDGVLVDFEGKMVEMGFVDIRHGVHVEDAILWGVMDIDHLFLKLKPLPDAVALFKYVLNHYDDVEILTACPTSKYAPNAVAQAAADKVEWVREIPFTLYQSQYGKGNRKAGLLFGSVRNPH
jgi:5'(3')-deoxyribonucleotidase